jgi:hypothetical protein
MIVSCSSEKEDIKNSTPKSSENEMKIHCNRGEESLAELVLREGAEGGCLSTAMGRETIKRITSNAARR